MPQTPNDDLLAKQRALQSLQSPMAQQNNPVQTAIVNQQQRNKQQGINFLQGQQEMDPQSDQSNAVKVQVLQQYPQLADHPDFDKMSGQDVRNLMQQYQGNQ